jgi:hypothetical protein
VTNIAFSLSHVDLYSLTIQFRQSDALMLSIRRRVQPRPSIGSERARVAHAGGFFMLRARRRPRRDEARRETLGEDEHVLSTGRERLRRVGAVDLASTNGNRGRSGQTHRAAGPRVRVSAVAADEWNAASGAAWSSVPRT